MEPLAALELVHEQLRGTLELRPGTGKIEHFEVWKKCLLEFIQMQTVSQVTDDTERFLGSHKEQTDYM